MKITEEGYSYALFMTRRQRLEKYSSLSPGSPNEKFKDVCSIRLDHLTQSYNVKFERCVLQNIFLDQD